MARFRPLPTELNQLPTPLRPCDVAVGKELAALDDEWTIYIRPRIGQELPSFLAVHDLAGVCAIEVEDWRPDDARRAAEGELERLAADGSWRRSPERPVARAARVRATIYDQYFALPSDGPEPTEAVRAVVILPHFTDATAVELLSRPVAGERERRIAVRGGDGLARELEQIVRGAGCAHPVPESIRRVHTHVAASERITGPPLPLGSGAAELAENPTAAPVRRVRGPAGSGKSIGLTARAARLAADGQRVLVLSFNVTVAHHLGNLVTARCREYGANPTLVTCCNFHSFCARVVDDAEQAGAALATPKGRPWPEAIVAKAEQAFTTGFDRRFDAILVDEGQDFSLDWWDLLRSHVLAPGGEMLLVADPTQDLYQRMAWHDEERMAAAGFTGPWVDLTGTYRLPADMVPMVDRFADGHLDGQRLPAGVPDDRTAVVGESSPSVRRWYDVDRVGDIGVSVGREVVRLLREDPQLAPRDVAFVCEYHHDGVAAVAEIEAAGYPVHHIFSRNPDDARRRRKYRFWPAADGVKGSTIHSFKGWQTTALVLGIGVEDRSKRMAYVALTRLASAPAGRVSHVSVVNADRGFAGFRSEFESRAVDPAPEADPVPPGPPSTAPWAPPTAAQRVG